jgi:hypothetical protein
MKPYPNFQDLERLSGITWGDLTALEPQLGELLWTARHACVTCRRWSDVARAFAPLRNTLAELVGFAGKHQRHPILGSAGAYQVAYWKLYNAVAVLLPGRAGGAEETPRQKHTETADETGSTESALTAPARA